MSKAFPQAKNTPKGTRPENTTKKLFGEVARQFSASLDVLMYPNKGTGQDTAKRFERLDVTDKEKQVLYDGVLIAEMKYADTTCSKVILHLDNIVPFVKEYPEFSSYAFDFSDMVGVS
jgi:hypothetical protein